MVRSLFAVYGSLLPFHYLSGVNRKDKNLYKTSAALQSSGAILLPDETPSDLCPGCVFRRNCERIGFAGSKSMRVTKGRNGKVILLNRSNGELAMRERVLFMGADCRGCRRRSRRRPDHPREVVLHHIPIGESRIPKSCTAPTHEKNETRTIDSASASVSVPATATSGWGTTYSVHDVPVLRSCNRPGPGQRKTVPSTIRRDEIP